MKLVQGVTVLGREVDNETRCAHYHGERDIIALKFNCCGQWYPCHDCHAELAGHTVTVWPKEEFGQAAILCGACGHRLTIHEYLACNSCCPSCRRTFNPACAKHQHLYFESLAD